MSTTDLIAAYPSLVFDLDGTLVDSAPDIGNTLSMAMADCGLAPWPADTLLPNLFSTLPGIVQELLESRGESLAYVEPVVEAFRIRQQTSAFTASRPYPGVLAFLEACHKLGKRMAVCTNKRHGDAVKMLAHFKLQDYFSHVIGCDSAVRAKPDPAPLLMVLAHLGARPAEALLFGDTHVDALCAQKSEVGFVWHRGGYGGDEVLSHPVAASFHSFRELGKAS
ncbi:HAD family hydrolase [Polaromonas sp.]|uniref:HAD family hydrolase n=1 Tax=Polaromonas sp. TaxID=1869339 RepID=UPI00356A91FD